MTQIHPFFHIEENGQRITNMNFLYVSILRHQSIFCAAYLEALDLVFNSIVQRFDQPGFEVDQNLQELILKALTRQNFDAEYFCVLLLRR